jgi:hypothetical protein
MFSRQKETKQLTGIKTMKSKFAFASPIVLVLLALVAGCANSGINQNPNGPKQNMNHCLSDNECQMAFHSRDFYCAPLGSRDYRGHEASWRDGVCRQF